MPDGFMGKHGDMVDHRRAEVVLAEYEETIRMLRKQLHQAQKMESMGRLAGGIAHDFNNMIGIILGHADLAILKEKPAGQLLMHLKEIRLAARRSIGLARQLLTFARKEAVAPRVLGLNETIEGMLKMLRRLMGEDIQLTWIPGKGLWTIEMDPSQVDQVLANLCLNARDAIGDVGHITIETQNVRIDTEGRHSRSHVPPGEYVQIDVSDDGCGMDKNTLEHIYDPFFTTKGVDKGTGLGLATVLEIVKQNNGLIQVQSELGFGTKFSICLPRHNGNCETAKQNRKKEMIPDGTETVLLVEDEPAILNMAREILMAQGYTVLAADSPLKALRMAHDHSGRIHLVVTDVIMPKMNGRELARKIGALHPQVRSLFMSGHTPDVVSRHGILAPGIHYIPKPFSFNELAVKVRCVLDESDAMPVSGRRASKDHPLALGPYKMNFPHEVVDGLKATQNADSPS